MSTYRLRPLWMAIAIAALLTLAACSTTTDTASTSPGTEPLPTWIDEVTPRPNAAYAPVEGVSVTYRPPGPDQEVRLIIDGVDVTADSLSGTDRLRYDADSGIVPLDVGTHTAEARLVIVAADGVDTIAVDSYTWTFRLA